MYRVELSKHAEKFLRSQPMRIKTSVAKKLLVLAENPDASHLDTKKMQGVDDIFRLRVGKIRVLYRRYDSQLLILVIEIGYRGDIYK